ncbi:MAG: NAD(P)/FAD-dependent oxidoreductase [Deltaproteobacteria bacterium]|nr:NAD(P)/FAD-dependent oxidoreductase [Deltaproteobacteria bacterium]
MREKSIVIVGGGIAGLAAGCYARMNGYRATILEMHKLPGGLCTAWKRKGYTFDISMHILVGSRSGAFHAMWRELGAVQRREFHYHRDLVRVESGDRAFVYGPDRGELEHALLAISPGDAALIREFVALLYGRSPMNAAALRAPELGGAVDKARTMLAILPLLPTFVRCGNRTVQQFAEQFRDPFLRQAVRFVIDGPGWPMLRYPLAALAGFCGSVGPEHGVPLGGSQAVAFDVAERFRGLGGELRCGARVVELLVESDRAAGVRLADGSEVRGDVVIWAADGHQLIFELLGGRYLDDTVRNVYERWTPVRPLVHVCLGVARDFSREPARLIFELERPFAVAGETRRWLSVLHHSFDPSAAPPGKAAVEVWYPSSYEYWERLAGRRGEYEAEKQRIADLTIAALDRRWPGLAAAVEVVDVPTPATYVRYTGNWKASPDGWYVTPENVRADPLRALPGLSDLWMCGQWTAPFTGTVLGALTGRQVVELLCRRDGVRFATSEP